MKELILKTILSLIWITIVMTLIWTLGCYYSGTSILIAIKYGLEVSSIIDLLFIFFIGILIIVTK